MLLDLKKYAFFFIDIYKSRKIFKDDQRKTLELLSTLAKYLNRNYHIKLSTPFTVREGDGILGGTANLALIEDIYERCLNFKDSDDFKKLSLNVSEQQLNFYFGVGIGNITTPSHTFNYVDMINGTAVSNAKRASEIAKIIVEYNSDKTTSSYLEDEITRFGNYYYEWQDFQMYIVTDDQLSKVLNPSFYLAHNKLISNKKQNRLFRLKKQYSDLKLYRIGKLLGYELIDTPKGRQKLSSQVSNLLNKSNFRLRETVLKDLESVLSELSE